MLQSRLYMVPQARKVIKLELSAAIGKMERGKANAEKLFPEGFCFLSGQGAAMKEAILVGGVEIG